MVRILAAFLLTLALASPAAATHRKRPEPPTLLETVVGAVKRALGASASTEPHEGTRAARGHRRHPVGQHGAVFATFYGGSDGLCGSKTASGERYDCAGMTAAHRTYPLGSHVNVCGPAACATLRISDRGPYANGADIDLSMAAAKTICGALTSCFVTIREE